MRIYDISLNEAVLILRHRHSETDCWEWPAKQRSVAGYGLYESKVNGKRDTRVAHRVVYELLVGPVPDSLDLHHLCGNKGCVNPQHLQPVTPQEHGRIAKDGRLKREHTTCRYGHTFSWLPNGNRMCKECQKRRAREWYRRNRKRILAKQQAERRAAH